MSYTNFSLRGKKKKRSKVLGEAEPLNLLENSFGRGEREIYYQQIAAYSKNFAKVVNISNNTSETVMRPPLPLTPGIAGRGGGYNYYKLNLKTL